MNLEKRIETFAALGDFLKSTEGLAAIQEWAWRAQAKNPWFTPENTRSALENIADRYLQREKLADWLSRYPVQTRTARKVGVVMAGNVPAVGFHDMLCVLMSGHLLWAKLSSQDPVLLKEMANVLIRIEPAWQEYIHFVERLNDAEAVIATGSDNSARYFHHYFGNRPNIIRQNRSSCAVLRGDETPEDLLALGHDILQYYGLGCRNVSKLFIPEDYELPVFLDAIQPLHGVINQNKYQNNYDYYKSIYLVNRIPHLDTGFLLLTEEKALVSPVSVVYFEKYRTATEAEEKIGTQLSKIQCVVSREKWFPGSLNFGTSQQPALTDYADGIDTMRFLLDL